MTRHGMTARRMITRTGKNAVWWSKSVRPSPADDVELAFARAASYGAERTRNLSTTTSHDQRQHCHHFRRFGLAVPGDSSNRVEHTCLNTNKSEVHAGG